MFPLVGVASPLWGEWILRAMRAKDERGLILKKSARVVVFSLPTSIVLTFIFIPSSHFTSAADAPFPSDFVCHLRLRGGRAPFVALRHFPRFIGDIYPFHRESLPQRGKQEYCFALTAFFLYFRRKSLHKYKAKPASKPTRDFYKLSRKSFKSVFCLGDNADNLSK